MLHARQFRGLASGAFATLLASIVFGLVLCLGGRVDLVMKAAGIPKSATGIGGFVNGAHALITPALVMVAAVAPIGLIAGGVVIYFTRWYVLDAVISIGIGCVIFWGAWRVLRESAHILLEGVPDGMDCAEVEASLRGADVSIRDIHHLHIWQLASGSRMATMHAELHEPADSASAARPYTVSVGTATRSPARNRPAKCARLRVVPR